MADQLLSQADVDALIASLTKNEPPKAAAPAPKPEAPSPAAAAPKPAPAAAPKPVSAAAPARPAAPASTVTAAAPAAAPLKPASAPVKADASNETINNLNARIADLTKQLNAMQNAFKNMEKKVSALEAKAVQNSGSANAELKIQQLTDEMRKIVTNLKGTPGYGARNNFTCEKCSDEGHVAVQYRCTSCGHERWYGWWPEKKKK